MQDGSNPFGHHVLPAAATCNSTRLCVSSTRKTKGHASCYSSGKGLWCQNKLVLQYGRWKKGWKKKNKKKNRHTQNLHVANPLKSPLCGDTCLRKSTLVWKMWLLLTPLTTFHSWGPRHVLLIWQYFLPGDIFMGALWEWRAAGLNGRPFKLEGNSSLCNRWGVTCSMTR